MTVGAIKVGTAPDVIIDRAELLLNVCAYCPAVFPAGYARRGNHERDLPPVIQPSVRNGAETPIAAALAFLGRS